MPSPHRLVSLALVLAASAPLAIGAEEVSGHDAQAEQAAIQMLADVTLIDGECRNVAINMGRALRAGEAAGLRPSDVMPAGPLRSAFEAAYRQRFAETPHDDLCEALVKRYTAEIPGLANTP